MDGRRRGEAGSGGTRIDGLDGIRALAVAAVVLHHAHISWAGGGFLGVDSFFVLSGFLITSLLLSERARRGRIDLAAFWSRRARRLLPALLVVVAVVAAAHAGNTEAARSVRIDAAAAIGYVANWRFLATGADYFGRTGDPSPLQHTWSLGIEEQFYLVWPLTVALVLGWLGRRRGRRALATVAVVGALGSAALMAILFRADLPARAYYGTDTRAQAILVGVALAFAVRADRVRRFTARPAGQAVLQGAAVVGLLATAWLWWQADGGSPALYRGGFLAAAVATGTIVAAVALVPGGAVGRALGVAPLRALGRISYGVYLWHWPIQLAVTNANTGWSGPPLLVGRMVLTVAVAAVSFVLVEEPIRRRAWPARQTLAGFATASVLVVAVLAAVLAPVEDPVLVASSATTTTARTATSTTATSTTTSSPPPPPCR